MRTPAVSVSIVVLAGVFAMAHSAAAQKPPAAPQPPRGNPPAPAAAPAKPGAPAAAPAKPAKTPTGPASSATETAVRKASKDYLAALNSGDFKTAATFWAPDGVYIDPSGRSIKARPVVAEELGKRFSGAKKPQLVQEVKSVRMLTPDSVLEEGVVEVQAPDGTAEPRGNFSTVWVKQQNKWLMQSVREASPAALWHYYTMSELGWLAGNWVAEAEGTTIRIQCTWTPGRAFLMREITVERDGQVKHSVTQRIGLDPLSPKIKSWSFDADGGLAEAFWDKSGDTWHVYSRGASRDGQMTTARNVYAEIGRDAYTLESAEAHLGSRSLPNFKMKFTRTGDAESETPAATATPAAVPISGGTPKAPPVAAGQQVPAESEAEHAAKQQILNSPEWRHTQQAYHEWLSVQKIYTPAEVKRLTAETAAKIAKMSVKQLQDFLEDSKEKVAILMSKDAEDARLWLAQRMAVEVKLTPAQLKESRPDIANMTAAQVEQRLAQIDQERKQTQDAQKAFDQGRQFRIKAIDEAEKEAESEREQALNRAAASANGGGYGAFGGGYGGYYGGGLGNLGYGGGGWGGGFWGGYRY